MDGHAHPRRFQKPNLAAAFRPPGNAAGHGSAAERYESGCRENRQSARSYLGVERIAEPDPIEHIIACNDDALKSIKIVLSALMQAAIDRKNELNISSLKEGEEEGSEEEDTEEEGEAEND